MVEPSEKQHEVHQSTSIESFLNFANTLSKFSSSNLSKLFNQTSIYNYLILSCIIQKDNNNSSETENYENLPTIIAYTTAKPFKKAKQYVDNNHVADS